MLPTAALWLRPKFRVFPTSTNFNYWIAFKVLFWFITADLNRVKSDNDVKPNVYMKNWGFLPVSTDELGRGWGEEHTIENATSTEIMEQGTESLDNFRRIPSGKHRTHIDRNGIKHRVNTVCFFFLQRICALGCLRRKRRRRRRRLKISKTRTWGPPFWPSLWCYHADYITSRFYFFSLSLSLSVSLSLSLSLACKCKYLHSFFVSKPASLRLGSPLK